MGQTPEELPAPGRRRLRPRVIISYIGDYVILTACIVGFFVLSAVEPYHQHFSLENKSLQYPYAVHERITIQQALCISGLFPLALITFYTLFIDGLFSHHKPRDPVSRKRKLTGPYRWKDRLWQLHCGVLGLVLSQCLAFVVTQVLKNACGKPRPDLIDRCQPNVAHDPIPFGLSNYTICQGDPKLIKDGFRSWPSGHSSSSFAGLVYLSLWVCGKLHVMDNRGEVWKTMLVMIPVLAATLIAVSRIMDARHHPFDVITGAALGTLCAFASYHQYFPPVTEAWKKGRAYPIRTWATEPIPPSSTYGKNDAARESMVALRNLDEERENDRELISTGFRPQSPPTSPTYPTGSSQQISYMHSHQLRGRDHNWPPSDDDVEEVFEMHPGYARMRNSNASVSRLQLYKNDSEYHLSPQPLMQVGAPARPDSVISQEEQGRQLSEMRY